MYAGFKRLPEPRRGNSGGKVMPGFFAAPTRGWVSAANLAAAPRGSAQILENFYPTATGIQMRKGCRLHGTAADAEPCESLMAYIGASEKLFAAGDGNIVELTSPADDDVIPTADVTGQTADYYAHANFATSGGFFMLAVNGADDPLTYDGTRFLPNDGTEVVTLAFKTQTANFTVGSTLTGGTSAATATILAQADAGTTGTLYLNNVSGTFQDTEIITDAATGSATADGTTESYLPAMAGSGLTNSGLSHVNTYRNRLWFVEAGTMNVWYLPTDSISGTLTAVSLAGIFRRGGGCLFTATWSYDSGDGIDDRLVIVSTEGEVAVFQSDPDLTDWGMVGRYDAAPPMGKNAFTQVGGDLLLLTEIGIVPMSAVVNRDPGALGLAAVTVPIQPDWLEEAVARRSLPWEIVKWPSQNRAYVTCPVVTDGIDRPICFAVNLETGAWSKVTGWNTRCMVLHDDKVYFGTNSGTVMQAEQTGADDGELIYYVYAGHMEHLGMPGRLKSIRQVRAIFRAKVAFNPRISVATDYQVDLPPFPSAATPAGASVWDTGLWDEARWDTGAVWNTVATKWGSVGKSGYAVAPLVQIVSGSSVAPGAELIAFDMTFEPGALVT